ncbi:MAG: ribbon-helix-helix protein, CopG family [Acidianus infernus]|nr:ribbon-helix-helix protein, CopG family [Acidianus infernus]
MTRTSVRLTEQEISKLDKISKLSNLTISDVIRAAIYRLLMGAPKPQLPATTDQIEKKYGYKCPYCDSLFPTVRALKIHLTRAHNGFPWCPVCYKSLKGKNPTNHFRRFPDPYHQFWYSISRKRYLASRYQKRKEVVRK